MARQYLRRRVPGSELILIRTICRIWRLQDVYASYMPILAYMKIDRYLTDEAVLQIIGQRLAAIRLSMNLTQGELAERAGVGLRTIQRMEMGQAATQLSLFLRVCRVLELMDRLDVMISEPPVSPMEMLRRKGRTRRRASAKNEPPTDHVPWTWGT